MVLVQKELKNAYIWIPNPTSIVLDRSFISLTTIWQTAQLTATIEPTVSDKTITWSSDDTTVATVSTTGLVTCVTPWECTITATTVNGLTATCSVGQWWQPDVSRTIFYYEFENNLNDSSGNWHNITASTWVWYNTVWWQWVIESTASTSWLSVNPSWSSSIWSWDFAISFWIKPQQPSSSRYPMLVWIYINPSPYSWPTIFYDPLGVNGRWDKIILRMRWGSASYQHTSTVTASSLYNSWHHIVMTRDNWTVNCYVDGVLDTTWSNDTISFPTSNYSWYIFWRTDFSDQSRGSVWVMWDKFILENIAWSSADIVAYYNQTKSLYGIS